MTTLPELVAQYAVRFHQGQDIHHVGSALGAWMLLASASAGVPADSRTELEDILGTSVAHASELVRALLEDPHPAAVSAMALWVDTERTNASFLEEWRAQLPATMEVGGVPEKKDADAWVDAQTLGQITQCPIEPNKDTLAILLNTLATKISWRVPFESVPVNVWESSTWKDITSILHTTGPTSEDACLARVDGQEYGVNIQRSRDGMLVFSVLGAAEESPASVLAAAHTIGLDFFDKKEHSVSLFDVDLADTSWNIAETTRLGAGPSEDGESYLVAWEATTSRELTDPDLGLIQAGKKVLGKLTDAVDVDVEVVQEATARYGQYGFEAAAVTAMHLFASAMMRSEEVKHRRLRLDFARPYAVVALAQHVWEARSLTASAWNGVPVFGAWVSKATEPTEN